MARLLWLRVEVRSNRGFQFATAGGSLRLVQFAFAAKRKAYPPSTVNVRTSHPTTNAFKATSSLHASVMGRALRAPFTLTRLRLFVCCTPLSPSMQFTSQRRRLVTISMSSTRVRHHSYTYIAHCTSDKRRRSSVPMRAFFLARGSSRRRCASIPISYLKSCARPSMTHLSLRTAPNSYTHENIKRNTAFLTS
jgi:hypothetical protein